jgi:hypothetical protein
MKRLIALLLLVVLAGCGTGVPDVDGTDWCYKFDFRLDDNGFNIAAGSWEDDLGLLTDGSGNLIFNYGFGTYVEPSFVIVVVQRPAGITGDINISAAGDVFGVSSTFNATMPAAISSYPVVAQPGTVGISGNSINVTAFADQDLLLQSIEIRGMGGSPFPTNLCDDSQPLTPSTDTPEPAETYTPSLTAAPTLTRTASPTPTPTNTPEGEWCYEWDFTVSDGDWTLLSGYGGTYSAGNGWTTTSPPDNLISIYWNFPTEINLTSFVMNWTVEKDVFSGDGGELQYHSNELASTADIGTGVIGFSRVEDIHQDGSISLPEDTSGVKSLLIYFAFVGFTVTEPAYIRSSRVEGSGTLPGFLTGGDECLPEPTPTPTLTPTLDGSLTATPAPTATPLSGWTCTMDFDTGGYGWVSAFNATYADVAGLQAWRATTTTPNSLGIRYVSPGIMPLTSIRIKGRTFGTRADDADELNFRTYLSSWSTYTEDSHNATAFDRTYSYASIRQARRIEIYLSVTQTNVAASRIDLVELRGVGGTNPCAGGGTPTATAAASQSPTGTGTGTLTPRPLLTGTAAPSTRTPIVFPTLNINATLVPGTPGTGTPPTAETGTPSTAIPPEQIGDETGEIIGFGWQIGWGLFRTLFAWVGQVTNDIGSILDSFINTPPQAIGGLPQCMTRPMESDICAIYYILDWTLLQPNTPGAFIIPLILIVMNFYIFIKFVSWVLRLIRRGEATTNVQ